MGYIGNQTSNAFTSITKQDLTGVTGSPAKRGFTLDHAVANANEIEVFVNNVRQEPAVAYTVSGTALTMTGDVETTDDFYVVFQGKAVGTVVPPDDSVTTARINDDAVTTAKIADDAVTEAKLSNDMIRLTELDIWRLNSNITTTGVTNTIVTAVTRYTNSWEKIGTGMSQSSGIFTFPSTGKYEIWAKFYYKSTANNDYAGGYIQLSTDSGSTYSSIAQAYNNSSANNDHAGAIMVAYLDVTDTSTMKIRFGYEVGGTAILYGEANNLRTHFVFKKIAET